MVANSTECWLRPNRRALAFAMAIPVVVLLLGVVMAAGWPIDHIAARVVGVAVGLMAMLAIAGLSYLSRLPRLGYRDGHLLVYLEGFEPTRVPIAEVECFFLGEGPSEMPGADEEKVVSSTIVVRLAEAADQWKHRDVKQSLGHWCDGYITIRGTWCEPITRDLMGRMNSRLVEIHRQRKNSPEIV